jgi:hypothetical protein
MTRFIKFWRGHTAGQHNPHHHHHHHRPRRTTIITPLSHKNPSRRKRSQCPAGPKLSMSGRGVILSVAVDPMSMMSRGSSTARSRMCAQRGTGSQLFVPSSFVERKGGRESVPRWPSAPSQAVANCGEWCAGQAKEQDHGEASTHLLEAHACQGRGDGGTGHRSARAPGVCGIQGEALTEGLDLQVPPGDRDAATPLLRLSRSHLRWGRTQHSGACSSPAEPRERHPGRNGRNHSKKSQAVPGRSSGDPQ